MTRQPEGGERVDVLLLTPPREILVNPAHSAHVIRRSGSYPPLGLAYLAGALEADGVQVKIVDLAENPAESTALAAELARLRPRIVGVSAMTFALDTVERLVALVRETLPEALLVLGGPCMEDFPREVVERLPAVDLGVVGEGEVTLREIVTRHLQGRSLDGIEGTVARRDGAVVLAPPRAHLASLDDLPRPAYHAIDFSRYSPIISRGRGFATMYTIRGCPFDCRYCHRQSWLRRVRYHSATRVVDEMEHLVRDLGVKEIKFYDETFTLDRKRVMAICDQVLERGLDVPWEIRTRPELLDREVVAALARAGCYRVCMGVEGGSDARLGRMGRTTRLEHVRNAFGWAREEGLSTLAFFMIGYPGDARADCEDVLRLAREIKATWIVVAITTAYANTEIYRSLVSSGALERDLWRAYTLGEEARVDTREVTFDGQDYSRDELPRMLSSLYWRYYLRPSQILRMLRDVRSWRQLASLARMAQGFVEARFTAE